MIQIYCGDGKGKTTAAAGLSIRAAGAGMNVLFLQFLKDGTSSEIAMLRQLGIRTASADCSRFTFLMDEAEKAKMKERHDMLLWQALAAAEDGTADMIVLDEIGAAVTAQLADEHLLQRLLDLCTARRDKVELVLTGRDPSERMLEAADYISRIHSMRHPYEKGVMARKGIEY